MLGGGGAKGAAHVGVLRVLEDLRIPIDCIAGTSMGALVGATFAAGQSPAAIEKQVLAIDWTQTVGGAGLRDRTRIHRKLAGAIYSNNFELALKGGQIRVPGGVLETQNVEEILRALVRNARLANNFDELPIPFRAIATDMQAGQMVVLDRGDLSVAMRASMAVPGLFAPVVMGKRVLADGGLIRNLPVDVVRQQCAEVVIAVSLASPPPRPDELTSALNLIGRTIDVMIDANQNAQLATLTERDVSIVVPMGDIGSASFDKVAQAIPLGRAAALTQLAALSRYSLPEADYRAWRASIDQRDSPEIRLAKVEITGLDFVNPAYVEQQLLNAKVGKVVSTSDIAADTSRVYALGDFQKVEYRISGEPSASILEINAVEKPWGPDFLRFDLGLAASISRDFALVIRGEHRRPWLNSLGGEWRSALQLGQRSILETALYQPFRIDQQFFIEPALRAQRRLENVFSDGNEIARYQFLDYYGQVDLGFNLDSRGQFRVGVRSGASRATLETGATDLPDLPTTQHSDLVVSAIWDTFDSAAEATQGTLAKLLFVSSGSLLGGAESYDEMELALGHALRIGGNRLLLAAAAGARLSGTLPTYRNFEIGGIRTFPGLEPGELRGDRYWTVMVNYGYKLADIQPLFGHAIYGGLRLQAVRMSNRLDGVPDGVIFGAAATVGGRTPLGPMLITLGAADNGRLQLQLAIGRPIEEGSMLDIFH